MNVPSFAILGCLRESGVWQSKSTDSWWFRSRAVGWIRDQVSFKPIQGGASVLLHKAGSRWGSVDGDAKVLEGVGV